MSDGAADSSLVSIARELSARPGVDVSRALGVAADERTRLAVESAMQRLGPPPGPFAWIALGSMARQELHCVSDQDSGLVWSTAAAAHSTYASDLARMVTHDLANWGLMPCAGGFTADHWSFDVPDWRRQFHSWAHDPSPSAVVDAEVFLDFRPLVGSLEVTDVLEALHGDAESARLQHGLAVATVSFPVHLTLFGHVRGQTFDTKREGLAPLVLLARLFALRVGSWEVGTVERLRDVGTDGVLSPDLIDQLIDVHGLLSTWRIQSQLADFAAGRPPSSAIRVDGLDADSKRRLEQGLRAIKSAQSAAALLYRTEL